MKATQTNLINQNKIENRKHEQKLKSYFKESINIKNNYNINLKFSLDNKIIIEIYLEANSFISYYKSLLTLNDLINLNPNFKSHNDIKDIYEEMNDMIKKWNYYIKYSNEFNDLIYLVLIIK